MKKAESQSLVSYIMATSVSPETASIWESKSPTTQLLSSLPSLNLKCQLCLFHVLMCLVTQHSANLTNRTLADTPVCFLKALCAFFSLYRAQHKWALHKCFLMTAMIALVSVVRPLPCGGGKPTVVAKQHLKDWVGF